MKSKPFQIRTAEIRQRINNPEDFEFWRFVELTKFDPEMAQVLNTIHMWGPTILNRLTDLEREIFMDVLEDVYYNLERVQNSINLHLKFQ